jgi:superoxide oxidase
MQKNGVKPFGDLIRFSRTMTTIPLVPFLSRLWPHRRTRLKILHFVLFPLALWFTLLDAGDNLPMTAAVLRFTSTLALIFVIAATIMTFDAWINGMASRPGPKLPPWAKRVHWWMHRILLAMVAFVPLVGLAIGITASRQLWAGGIVPIGVPFSLPRLNFVLGEIHKWQFYALSALIAGHALFHIWRHVRLKDNALRIMAPKAWHRFL